ncbi:PREDICTED: spore wall protein 1-like [Wasmannia auropunctata]|uniref:spore wall protein 1-like n=1 Tax=Wasmannia auropunctata TaxID=64793 RepID=UPI0005F01974|nr:PREDICTED: spore wall protein 1-like [Wasmannia auropunctata]
MGCKILPLLILAFAVVFVKAHDQQRTIQIGINMATKIMEGIVKCIHKDFGIIPKIFNSFKDAFKLLIGKLPLKIIEAIQSVKKQFYEYIVGGVKTLVYHMFKISLEVLIILLKIMIAIMSGKTKICNGGSDKIIEEFEKLVHILEPLLSGIGGAVGGGSSGGSGSGGSGSSSGGSGGGGSGGIGSGIGIPGIKIPGY